TPLEGRVVSALGGSGSQGEHASHLARGYSGSSTTDNLQPCDSPPDGAATESIRAHQLLPARHLHEPIGELVKPIEVADGFDLGADLRTDGAGSPFAEPIEHSPRLPKFTFHAPFHAPLGAPLLQDELVHRRLFHVTDSLQ